MDISGLAGDGVTDDSPAINAALAKGGKQTLPGGRTYLCKTRLLTPSSICLEGDRTAVLQFAWVSNSSGAGYIMNTAAGNVLGNQDITLRGFTIRGAWKSGLPYGAAAGAFSPIGRPTPACGIIMRRVDNLSLEELTVKFVPGMAVAYQGVDGGRIVGNRVSRIGRDGITGGPFIEHPLRDVEIAGNDVRYVGDDAIAVHAYADASLVNIESAPSGIHITNNKVYGYPAYMGTTGLVSTLKASAVLTMIDPLITWTSDDIGKIVGVPGANLPFSQIKSIESPTSCTLTQAAGQSITAEGCWSHHAGRGIMTNAVTDSVISDNLIENTFSVGLSLSMDRAGGWRNSRVKVQRNVVLNGGGIGDYTQPRYGIRLTDADDCIVTDNVTSSPAVGLFETGNQRCVIERNTVL